MSWRYAGLSLILTLATMLFKLPAFVVHQQEVPAEWFAPPPLTDPESRLAMGLKIPLSCADAWSLELIKGVSGNLVLELLEGRREILRAAQRESDTDALQRAHGVGEKTAQRLVRYLDLTTRCKNLAPLEAWPGEAR